jgi:hypothetical protein
MAVLAAIESATIAMILIMGAPLRLPLSGRTPRRARFKVPVTRVRRYRGTDVAGKPHGHEPVLVLQLPIGSIIVLQEVTHDDACNA